MSTLKMVRQAAHKARVQGKGRRSKLREREIVGLALAFCARFSTARPSSDENNFFRAFAERFFEYATSLSAEEKGQGIGRQITWALQRLPIEKQRAALLNENR